MLKTFTNMIFTSIVHFNVFTMYCSVFNHSKESLSLFWKKLLLTRHVSRYCGNFCKGIYFIGFQANVPIMKKPDNCFLLGSWVKNASGDWSDILSKDAGHRTASLLRKWHSSTGIVTALIRIHQYTYEFGRYVIFNTTTNC